MRLSRAAAAMVVLAIALLPATAARAATITVGTTGDPAIGLDCSLRQAISSANSDSSVGGCVAGSGADELVLAGGTYRLTIPGASENANATGDLDVTEDLTIRGAGRELTTIDADGPSDDAPIDRVLQVVGQVSAATSLTIEDLGVTGGHAPDGVDAAGGGASGGQGGFGEDGGGILNSGNLTIRRVAIFKNFAGDAGDGGDASAGADGPSDVAGGSSTGGTGGTPGSGGGVYSVNYDDNPGSFNLIDGLVHHNEAGDGGDGGDGGAGGDGGDNSVLFGGANGGNSTGGRGGQGGHAGGLFVGGDQVDAVVSRTEIYANRAGDAGDGGHPSDGGDGGASSVAKGGAGGGSTGGPGGTAGFGGGAMLVTDLDMSLSTVRDNVAGDGGEGGAGGSTGQSGSGVEGGYGPDSLGGAGGPPGSGGGLSLGDHGEQMELTRITVSGNRAGDAGDGGGAGSGSGDGRSFGGAGAMGGEGAGIAKFGGNLFLVNSTLASNETGDGSSGGDGGLGPRISRGGPAGPPGRGAVRAVYEQSRVTHGTIAFNVVGEAGAPGAPGSGSYSSDPGAAAPGQVDGGVAAVAATPTALSNTLVASNEGSNCSATGIDYLSGNLFFPSEARCGGELTGNPLLQPLADNGGETDTMALGAGSAALDRIARAGANCPATDQRGVARPAGFACDVGAFESPFGAAAPPGAIAKPNGSLPSPLTAARIKAALTPGLRLAVRSASRAGLEKALKRRAVTLRGLGIPAAGKLTGSASAGGAAIAKVRVVAKGSKRFSKAGKGSVKLKLTKAGKRLLRRAKRRAKLTVRLTFVATSGARATVSRSLTLKRKQQHARR